MIMEYISLMLNLVASLVNMKASIISQPLITHKKVVKPKLRIESSNLFLEKIFNALRKDLAIRLDDEL